MTLSDIAHVALTYVAPLGAVALTSAFVSATLKDYRALVAQELVTRNEHDAAREVAKEAPEK